MIDPLSRGRALAALCLALAGLAVVGRLGMDAWMVRPAPAQLPTETSASRPAYAPASGDPPSAAPRAPAPAPTAPPAPPLMIGIVDGLRAEVVEGGPDPAMPFWRSLASEGASGIGVAGEPTLTACCVRTILTGRNPDLLTAFRNFTAREEKGSVTDFLTDRGARAAHAGDASAWQIAQSRYAAADVLAFKDQGPVDQGGTDDRSFPFALEKAAEPGVGLLTFHVVRPDHAGHKHGATGPEYRAACRTSDDQMRRVVLAFRAAHPGATVLLAADHGVTPRGTHGGGEPGARRAPFVLVGPRVAHVEGVEVPQSALAPTLSALLGLPMPPLAEAPPAFEVTTLSPAQRADALDAYVRARLEVARRIGARDVAEAISARRGRVFAEGAAPALTRLAEEYRELEAKAFSSAGAASAVAAILLAAVWLASLGRAPAAGPGDRLPLEAVTAVVALVAGFYAPTTVAGVALLAACAAYAVRGTAGAPGARTLALGGLAALPVLAAAGLLLQEAFDASEDARPAAWRLAGAALVMAAAGLYALTRAGVRGRLRALAEEHPALVPALGGVGLGFTLSLRPFVDPFVHLPILFAVAAGAAVLAVTLTPSARAAAPRARWLVLAVAAVLLVGGRTMEGVFSDWTMSPRAVGLGWRLATLAAVVAVALWARRAAAGRGDLAAVGPALVACLCAGLLRTVAPGAPALWWMALSWGLAALALTLFAGGPDARLAGRLLACVALASVLHERSDAQLTAFAVFAVGCLAASHLRAPRTRLGVAALAVLLLAVRIATFHALGFTESFSTIDTGAGIVPGAASAAAEAAGGGVDPHILANALLLCLKFALVWIALLASAARAFEREGSPDGLRWLAAYLALTFASRGAAIVAGMWVWWRSSWWVATAYPVYALGAADVLLVLAALGAVGGWWSRKPAAEPRPGALRPA